MGRVSGINREFALTTDQSCLNRWLTEVEWDVTALNDRRLAWLQQAPQTRYSGRGVIAIDNTLVTHEGKLIEDVGWFWDHGYFCISPRKGIFQLSQPSLS